MPGHRQKPIREDGREGGPRRAVVEDIGRSLGVKLEIDFDRVSLTGADAFARLVELESLLVVVGDDLPQQGEVDGHSGASAPR